MGVDNWGEWGGGYRMGSRLFPRRPKDLPPPRGLEGCLGPWPAPADRPPTPRSGNFSSGKNEIYQRGPKFEADFRYISDLRGG